MPKLTEYEKRKDFYQKISNDKSAKKNKDYQNLVNSLKDLNNAVKDFYEADKDGHYKEMDTDAYDKIVQSYQLVQKNSNIFLKAANSNEADKFSKSRLFIATELDSIINKDLKSLLTVDRAKPGPLHGIVKEARSVSLDLSGQLSKTGEKLSSRIPIKNNKTNMKGFFTKETIFNPEQKWDDFIKKNGADLPEYMKYIVENCGYEGFYKAVEKYEKLFIRGRGREEDDLTNPYADSFFKSMKESVSKNKNAPTPPSSSYTPYDMEKFSIFIDKAITDLTAENLLHGYGIQSNTEVANRNVAMSNVAKLLGCSDVIAKSIHMTIEVDGQKQKGIFMENAEGLNISLVSPDDPYYDYELDVYNQPQPLRQLADLQVLDYICGNADRHLGNIMYNFGKDENGKTVLKNIKGIDNDCSFGNITKATGKMIRLHNLKFIDEKTASMITRLDENVLDTVLGPDIPNAKEREAAKERLNQVKTAILNKEIYVIKADEWKHYDMSSLQGVDKGNLFYYLENFAYNNKFRSMEEKTDFKTISDFDFNDAETKIEKKEWDLPKELSGIKELSEKMKATDKFYIGSKEFRTMRDSLYALDKKIDSLYQGKTEPKPEDLENLYSLSHDLMKNTRDYIAKKDITQSTEHGKNRMALARELEAISDHLSTNVLSSSDPNLEPQEMEEDVFSM